MSYILKCKKCGKNYKINSYYEFQKGLCPDCTQGTNSKKRKVTIYYDEEEDYTSEYSGKELYNFDSE